MDLDLLRSFVAVVDSGGFSRAGARVHRTQSTISQQIARLEEYLGQALFNRDKRTVSLTEHGEHYLGYARRMLALEGEARAVLRSEEKVSYLRLGVTDSFAVARLPAILSRFAARNPLVRLEVVAALSAELRARLDTGRLDLAVLKEAEPAGGALLRWPESLHWAMKATGMSHRERPVPLVAFPQGCVHRNRGTAALDAAGIAWRVAYESSNWSGVKAAVEGGLGVAVLADLEGFRHVRFLTRADGLPPVEPVHVALRAAETPLRGAAAELKEEIARLVAKRR